MNYTCFDGHKFDRPDGDGKCPYCGKIIVDPPDFIKPPEPRAAILSRQLLEELRAQTRTCLDPIKTSVYVCRPDVYQKLMDAANQPAAPDSLVLTCKYFCGSPLWVKNDQRAAAWFFADLRIAKLYDSGSLTEDVLEWLHECRGLTKFEQAPTGSRI